MNYIKSTVNTLRDRYTPVSHTSTFRTTGQITPEEFLAAGDYLVYKFPTWSWADADDPSRRVSYFPPGKQFLVTRNVPCHRRLNEDFAGDAGHEESLVNDGDDFKGDNDEKDEDGWLRTGGLASSQPLKAKEVRTVDESGNAEKSDAEEDDIPDMEDEDDDEAIIRDTTETKSAGRRTYTLYIMYTPYYRTPRLYLSGYLPNGQPLPPTSMMEDIVGDMKDKTVTLEDFPFFANNIKMASVHPCKHAPVMKSLLDRADAALKVRREKMARGQESGTSGMEGLVDEIGKLDVKSAQESADKDEWEEVGGEEVGEEEVAIRVDQYLVVFLKVSFQPPKACNMNANKGSSWRALRLVSSTTSRWAFRRSECLTNGWTWTWRVGVMTEYDLPHLRMRNRIDELLRMGKQYQTFFSHLKSHFEIEQYRYNQRMRTNDARVYSRREAQLYS